MKKNETYKAFGFELWTEKLNTSAPPYTRFTIYFVGETPELVYMWIDCFGDEAAQITSFSDIEKLLDNVISFVDEEDSNTENLNVFGPSSSKASRLLGSDESVASKKIRFDNFIEFHKNEKM